MNSGEWMDERFWLERNNLRILEDGYISVGQYFLSGAPRNPLVHRSVNKCSARKFHYNIENYNLNIVVINFT
jgi:hypothetical protein